MDNIRLFLFISLAFISLMLWEAWQKDYPSQPPVQDSTSPTAEAQPSGVPVVSPSAVSPSPAPVAEASTTVLAETRDPIFVDTDLFSVTISPVGGTIERAALLSYPMHSTTPDIPIELLGIANDKAFIYEGGLAGASTLPTHHAVYRTEQSHYRLAPGNDELVVPLLWQDASGLAVEKRITFKRGSYLVTVEYRITNNGSAPLSTNIYEQLKRKKEPSLRGMVYTFTGPVLSTPTKRFEKFKFDDLDDKPIDVGADDAWIGIMQHYFVTALIPAKGAPSKFYSKVLDESHYLVGYIGPQTIVAPNTSATLKTSTYIGPKRHDIIAPITPGLELTVDFGMLWFIAKPLFVVLQFINNLTGNWGWAIIIVTVILKGLFYPLSAAGYRSMANMRKVQPRMLALRDRHANDRAQLNAAMMKLYKDEKINPLGGCLPILIQIPVFISLYWVLLESVEMRQAPFILWVMDLSEKDPYFVLPLLMGISMWMQQKLNPAPLDPTQAKVMQILPFVFTVFFAFFPSGLVLYWLVNNILSMAQQWSITRAIEKGASA